MRVMESLLAFSFPIEILKNSLTDPTLFYIIFKNSI